MKKVRLKGIPKPVEVNEDGSVIMYLGKKRRIYLLKGPKNERGYRCCSIAGKNFYVHHIIAEAYVPNPRPLAYKLVIHLNGDSLDNHYSNLAWGDNRELYKLRVKLGIPGVGDANKNINKRPNSKISEREAIKIAKRLDKGEYASDICKEYDVSEMSIARIRKRYCKNNQASPRYGKEIRKTVYKLSEKYFANEIAEITGIKYHTIYRWLKSKEIREKNKRRNVHDTAK
ncbi:MAG: helix-turn-helix domain-containing protein [Bacteroidetes bacterium]|nr:helix-turn-helix domain-containing protein [Bacteroidota bacterium]